MRSFKYENYSLIVLLICLLAMLLLFPFMGNLPESNLILKIFISVVMIAAVNATMHKRSYLIIGIVLGALAIVTSWSGFFESSRTWITVNVGTDILFVGYVIVVHLLEIMRIKEVNKNLLFGAICVYILMGLFMSFVYILIELYVPNSFGSAMSPIVNGHYEIDVHFLKYIYYSFVSLTTLGFGDITPLSPQAQAFTYMEAVAGQFYLTILVARLVGLYISRHKS